MRFQIGQTYVFTKLVFKRGFDRFGNAYLPWADSDLKILVQVLKCEEHHKVPAHYREEEGPTCDGFIFRNVDDSTIWYNQYPRASYGQMDDSYDRKVLKKDGDLFEDCYTLMDATIENVVRGFSFVKKELGQDHLRMLLAHFHELRRAVDDIGFKLVMEPIKFTRKREDGSTRYSKSQYPRVVELLDAEKWHSYNRTDKTFAFPPHNTPCMVKARRIGGGGSIPQGILEHKAEYDPTYRHGVGGWFTEKGHAITPISWMALETYTKLQDERLNVEKALEQWADRSEAA